MAPSQIEKFKHVIAGLPDGTWNRRDLLIPELLLESENQLEMYYAPFDYIHAEAKIAIVGITPGFTQMGLSLRQAKDDLRDGIPLSDIDRRAKFVASFGGPMRRNLIGMLNELQLPAILGIADSAELFSSRRSLIHTTSVIRYPLYQKGENYTGHQPAMWSSPLIRRYILSDFADELVKLSQAVIIPLGKSVSDVLRRLAEQPEGSHAGLEARCLFDFPHPSGANGHRLKQFAALKEQHRSILANSLS